MDRPKQGLAVVDKPAGMSSFDVIRKIRQLADMRKVGHAGTLDPEATGVLVVVLGRCTKLLPYSDLDRKVYDFTIRLGEATETHDVEGEVVERRAFDHIERGDVEEALATFIGEIEQVPPVYSAIKVDGDRAHELARAGEEVELEARPIQINDLELLDWSPPRVQLRVDCGSGTYVRSLARDLSIELDTVGHTTAIRRRRVGPMTLDDAVPLEELDGDNFWSMVESPLRMVDHLQCYAVEERKRKRLRNGNPIWVSGRFEQEEFVAGHDEEQRLLAVLECTQTRDDDTAELWPRRVMV